MAHFRPAAPADADHRPHRVARLARTSLLAAILPVAAGCAAAAGRGEPSSSTLGKPGTGAGARSAQPNAATSSLERRAASAVAEDWGRAEQGFYEAALEGDPTLPSYIDWLVAGGPVYQHAIAYLTSLAVQGLVGPAHWRFGNVKVLRIEGGTATLQACSWDAGSRWKSTGAAAPANLGGGAGYTAYRSIMRHEHGRWLVWQTATETVENPTEAGPCMHF